MKSTILFIAILLTMTEIGCQPLRPTERDSNPLDHILQKLPIKEVIALKIKLLPLLNQYLPMLNKMFGGKNHQEFPRHRPEFPRRQPEFPSHRPLGSSKMNSTAIF